MRLEGGTASRILIELAIICAICPVLQGATESWFEPNMGQVSQPARFVARMPGYTVALNQDASAVYVLNSKSGVPEAIRMSLIGRRPSPELSGEGALTSLTRFYRGEQTAAAVEIPNYSSVSYHGVYPGIDLLWRFRGDRLEYEFRLAAGADANALRICFAGEKGIAIELNGDLLVTTASGQLRYHHPVAWQEIGGRRAPIRVAFRLQSGVVGFTVGPYDKKQPFKIDPVLQYSTYLGGSGFDAAYAVTTDPAGNVYTTGQTASFDFPSSGAGTGVRTTRAVFVTKMSADASHVLFTTILASTGNDCGQGLALDGAGNIWVTGIAGSSGFPTTTNALHSASNGGQDAFVAKLDPSGRLSYATYLGGSGTDAAMGIAVDQTGVYVAGYTASTNFPITQGAPQTTFQGGFFDAFLLKLNLAGSGLLYSTYSGGSGNDTVAAIAVDGKGDACIAGQTASSSLPLSNAIQSNYGGNGDILLGCLNPAGTAWNLLTYLGGSGPDAATAIALDSSGNIYLTGTTYSPNFPVSSGAYQAAPQGDYDAFAVKLNPTGTAIVFSTLLGGSGSDSGTAIAVGASGAVWVAGYTTSVNFPASLSPGFAGYYDGFITELSSDGTSLPFASYLGGSGDDRCLAMALSDSIGPIIVGMTGSVDFPTTDGVAQSSSPTPYNAFVSRVTLNPAAVSVAPSSGAGTSQTFSFAFFDPIGASDVAMVQMFVHGASSGTACYVVVYPPERSIYLFNDANTALTGPILPGAAGTVQNSQCTLNGAGSSITASGNTLTVNLAIAFPGSFAGAKQISAYAQSVTAANSGWQTLGAWTVQLPTVQVLSLSPSSGSGTSATFNFAFSDTAGASDLAMVQMFVYGVSSGTACYVVVYPPARSIYLFNDANTGLIGPVTPGTGGTVQNSQCTLNGAGSSMTASGNTLTVDLAIAFPGSFAGAKQISAYAQSVTAANSGWQTLGSWTVQLPTVQVLSLSPSSGSGTSATFNFAFSDSAGTSDLAMVQMFVYGASSGTSCYVVVYPPARSIYLFNDANTGLTGPITPGTSGTVQNTQCTLNGASSSITASGNTLTVNLAIAFSGSFTGTKQISAYAQSVTAANSGWQTLGSWTVQLPAVQVLSLSPSSGSGTSATFNFAFSDSAGTSDLAMVQMFVYGASSGTACYIVVYPPGGSIYLFNDANTALTGPVTPGAAGTVQNSQCTLNGAGSSITASGNTLTVNLAIAFSSSFAGTKQISAYAQSVTAANSGWQTLGSWTAP